MRAIPGLAPALAALIAAGAAHAGKDPVIPVPMVFVPPLAMAPPPAAAAGAPASEGATAAIAARIEAAVRFCRGLPHAGYALDCVAAGLADAAAAMPAGGDYAAARAAVAGAAGELRAIAAANRDPALPPARVRRGAEASSRALVAVDPTRAAAASAAAAAAIGRAQTVLLRSAADPALRPHYQAIAAAVGSARVLLRSA